MSDLICVYTDGACRGNPGPGGWGALIVLDEEEITLFGGENNTTNNRMEMTAAIEALSYFSESSSIKLTTDSNYLKDGIEKWVSGWKKNGWKTKLAIEALIERPGALESALDMAKASPRMAGLILELQTIQPSWVWILAHA